jgi:hypothetical protein
MNLRENIENNKNSNKVGDRIVADSTIIIDNR